MNLDLSDIQELLLFAHARLPEAVYLHLGFESAGSRMNAWLREVSPEITNAAGPAAGDSRVHVALTHSGLARLGLEEKELASFPREFRHGMGHPLRAHVLGDVGESSPTRWAFGGPEKPPIHALVLLFAKDATACIALRDRIVLHMRDHGGTIIHEDRAVGSDREPFGFRDGIGQPHVAGSPRKKIEGQVEVPAGEFVLGYANVYGELPESPRGRDDFDLGQNGSFLVYRTLRQDTSAFWRCLLGHANDDLRIATKLAARIVGRWPSGAPIVTNPDFDPGDFAATDDFGYAADPDGMSCPIGAHVRRTNPRDMFPGSPARRSAHRLLRRGRVYGPPTRDGLRERAKDDGVERGLVFIAFNTNIRRQFEFVQQTWLNNPKFGNLYDERDPLVSSHTPRHFSIPGTPSRQRLRDLPSFVTTRGGGYFFFPGLRAIDWLSARTPR